MRSRKSAKRGPKVIRRDGGIRTDIYFPPEVRTELDRRCKESKKTRQKFIVELIVAGLKEQPCK